MFTCLPAESWCWHVTRARGLLSGWHGSTAARSHFSPPPPPISQMLGFRPRGNSTTAIPNVSQEPLFSSHPPQPCNSAPTNSSPPCSQRALVLGFISTLKTTISAQVHRRDFGEYSWGRSSSNSFAQTQLLLFRLLTIDMWQCHSLSWSRPVPCRMFSSTH